MKTRIAVPVQEDHLHAHFGEAKAVAFFDVDHERKTILRLADLPTPPRQPGVLPRWIAQQKVDVVIAGGIGERAVLMLADAGIRVMAGAPRHPALDLVTAWRDGCLSVSGQVCPPCDDEEGRHHDHGS